MGNALQTTGQAVSGVSSMLGVVPVVGTALSAIGGIAGGLMQHFGAKKQAEEAAKAQNEAMRLKTDKLRPEYLQKLRMDKMLALGDAPGTDFAKRQLETQTANQLRAIRESSPSGGATVNAISAALNKRYADEQSLAAKNMGYRVDMQGNVIKDLEMLGDKGMQLEERRDAWKRMGLQAASALRNAADANKMTAANTIIGGLTSTASGLGKIAQNQAYINAINNAYSGNAVSGKTEETIDLTQNADGSYGSDLMQTSPNYSFAEPTTQEEYNSLIMKATSGLATKDELLRLQTLRTQIGG